MEFELAAPAGRLSKTAPAELTVDGRYLYGAPASGLSLEGELVIGPAKERPGFPGYRFGLADEEVDDQPRDRSRTCRRPTRRARRRFTVSLDKVPVATRPLEAQVIVRMAESGGRAVERKLTLPIVPDREHDRRQAAVLRPLARRGRDRERST